MNTDGSNSQAVNVDENRGMRLDWNRTNVIKRNMIWQKQIGLDRNRQQAVLVKFTSCVIAQDSSSASGEESLSPPSSFTCSARWNIIIIINIYDDQCHHQVHHARHAHHHAWSWLMIFLSLIILRLSEVKHLRHYYHKTESTTQRIKHIKHKESKHNISKHRESNTQNTTQHNTRKPNTPVSVLVSATTAALPPPSVPVLKIERCTFAAEIQSARQSVILLRESSRCLFHTLWLAGTSCALRIVTYEPPFPNLSIKSSSSSPP